jgi:protein-disulfide isomerase
LASREERKRQARERRLELERQAQDTARRRRRLQTLAGVAVAAVVVVVVAVVASSGGGNKPKAVVAGKPASGGARVAAELRGIPESGNTLGKPSAPVTMVEFIDLKCPVCQAYTLSAFPDILRREVRPGRLRVQPQVQTFVGDAAAPGDSERAGRMALAAGRQEKFWPFTGVFYLNQQDENTSYVTDPFLTSIGRAVPGLDVQRALAERGDPSVSAQLRQASHAFDANGFTGTPSFLIGPTGGRLEPFTPDSFTDPKSFESAIDKAAKS